MPWSYVRHTDAAVEEPPVSGLDLAVWLDASDTTTVSVVGGKVTGWKEKKTGKWFTQSNTNQQPIINTNRFPLQAIDFAASGSTNKFMRLPVGDFLTAPSPTEAYIVHYWGSPPSAYACFAIFNGSSTNAIQGSGGTPYYMVFRSPPNPYSYQYYQGGVLYYYSTNTPAGNSKNIATMYSAPQLADSRIYRNGIVAPTGYGSGTIQPTDKFTSLGSSDGLYYSHGVVAEILVYTRPLMPAERDNTIAYLTSKWGQMAP